MSAFRDNPDDVPIHLSAALDAKKQGLKAYRHRRGHFLDAVGITQKQQGTKLAGVPTISLNRLRKPYPPSGHDIYESPSAHKIWKKHRKTTPYPDSRYTWKPFHSLNPARLQHIVRGNESAIIRDSRNNELVGLVIRNFTDQNPRLLAWVNNIIMENIEVRKSVRVGVYPKVTSVDYLNNIPAGRSWEVVPNWLYGWFTQQPSTWMGSESAMEADRCGEEPVDV